MDAHQDMNSNVAALYTVNLCSLHVYVHPYSWVCMCVCAFACVCMCVHMCLCACQWVMRSRELGPLFSMSGNSWTTARRASWTFPFSYQIVFGFRKEPSNSHQALKANHLRQFSSHLQTFMWNDHPAPSVMAVFSTSRIGVFKAKWDSMWTQACGGSRASHCMYSCQTHRNIRG